MGEGRERFSFYSSASSHPNHPLFFLSPLISLPSIHATTPQQPPETDFPVLFSNSLHLIYSFFLSIEECIKIQPGTYHHVNIIDDNSCIEHIEYLKYLVKYFNKGNLKVQLSSSSSSGIVETIKDCWNWLEQEGKQLVFQVQDDYLFEKNAIFEIIDVFLQIDNDLNTHPIVIPYNDPYLWNTTYKYNPTPRVIMPGKNRYWVQTYDISCTFLTSKIQFSKHWDMYEKFVTLGSDHSRVEIDSINKIVSKDSSS